MTTDTKPLYHELWNYQDLTQTQAALMALLPETAVGSSAYIQLLTQIARTHSLQSHFAEAHRWLDIAQNQLQADQAIAQIRLWLERGRTHNSAGDKQKASRLFRQAFDLANTIPEADYFAVDAAHMLGISEPLDDQLAWTQRALALAEASSHPTTRQWLGVLTNNLGWTHHDLGAYETALALFEQGLAWRKTEERPFNPQAVHIATYSVGRALRSLGQYAQALTLQQALWEKWTDASPLWRGHLAEEIGECLLAQGQAGAATPFWEKAYMGLATDSWLQENESARLARLAQLAGLSPKTAA